MPLVGVTRTGELGIVRPGQSARAVRARARRGSPPRGHTEEVVSRTSPPFSPRFLPAASGPLGCGAPRGPGAPETGSSARERERVSTATRGERLRRVIIIIIIKVKLLYFI